MEHLGAWPFVVASLIFATAGQTMKRSLFSWERIGDGKGPLRGALWWGRKTLPLHPVVTGALLGLVPGLPVSPGVPDTTAAHCLYFAGAGVASTWVFAVLRGLLKSKGIELGSIAPESSPPRGAP